MRINWLEKVEISVTDPWSFLRLWGQDVLVFQLRQQDGAEAQNHAHAQRCGHQNDSSRNKLKIEEVVISFAFDHCLDYYEKAWYQHQTAIDDKYFTINDHCIFVPHSLLSHKNTSSFLISVNFLTPLPWLHCICEFCGVRIILYGCKL